MNLDNNNYMEAIPLSPHNEARTIRDITVWRVYREKDKLFDELDHPDKARDVLKWLRDERHYPHPYAVEQRTTLVQIVTNTDFE